MERGKKGNGGKQKRGKEMRKIENSAVNHNFLLAVIEPKRLVQLFSSVSSSRIRKLVVEVRTRNHA
jgi:hypothetical protein